MSKVFWSSVEKALVISKALDTQGERPELSGLPLLREAMRSLPLARRRKIVTLVQVEWFELGINEENRRRAIQFKESKHDLFPLQSSWIEMHSDWKREQVDSMRRTEELLERLCESQQAIIQLLKDSLAKR